MPEGTLQLEHLMQATKLLQLKKASLADIEIIYDVCWMLTPTQIQSTFALLRRRKPSVALADLFRRVLQSSLPIVRLQ